MAIPTMNTGAQKVIFGANRTNTETQKKRDSQFWLNIGYSVDGMEPGEKYSFVSPQGLGVAIDHLEAQPIRGDNQEFNQFRKGGNYLLDQLQRLAATMKPGEVRRLDLQVELRRRNDDQAETMSTDEDDNKFIRKLSLVAA